MSFEDFIHDRILKISSLTEYEKELIESNFSTFYKIYLMGCLDITNTN